MGEFFIHPLKKKGKQSEERPIFWNFFSVYSLRFTSWNYPEKK